jgi:hypothetical protein
MAANMLQSQLSGKPHGGGGHGGGRGSNPLGQLIGGLTHSGGGGHGGGHGGGGAGGIGGKLAGQLASNLFSSGNNKPSQPTNYHGGQQQNAQHHGQGGLAGSVMGGITNLFHGSSQGQSVRDQYARGAWVSC